MMIVHSSNRRKRFFWSTFALHRQRRYFIQWLSFVIVSHSSWLICFIFVLIVSSLICICSVVFVSLNDLCRFQNDQVFLSNDLKTIMSTQIDFFESFFTFWSFYSVLNSCMRKWHSAMIKNIIKRTWWWSMMMINEWCNTYCFLLRTKCFHALRLHNLIFLFSSICLSWFIFCLSRWSYYAICLWKLFVMRNFMHFWKCFVFYYQSFFINVFFEKSTSSSFAWVSLRCLNCSNSLVAKKYLNILIVNSKMFKNVVKFISRLSAHIFFRSSSNFKHFSNVWYIVCLRISHEHLKNSIVFILWR
jgi:hypothetical protein